MAKIQDISCNLQNLPGRKFRVRKRGHVWENTEASVLYEYRKWDWKVMFRISGSYSYLNGIKTLMPSLHHWYMTMNDSNDW